MLRNQATQSLRQTALLVLSDHLNRVVLGNRSVAIVIFALVGEMSEYGSMALQ